VAVIHNEAFTPTPGQTVFTLELAPNPTENTVMVINGKAEYSIGDDPAFTISGVDVTWLNSYTLGTDDRIVIDYTSGGNPAPPSDAELRESSGYVLREDGSKVLREI
jgi:hypothetical protein